MPIELGVMAHGASQHPLLSQQPDLIYQVSSGSLFESVLFLEGNLLRLGPWLPDPMLFAAFRGFSWLLLFLAMPPLLRRLGATAADVVARHWSCASSPRPACGGRSCRSGSWRSPRPAACCCCSPATGWSPAAG